MTTYTWPTSRHFVPATHELRVVDNTQRTVESSLSGYVQTNAMPGARWGWGMDFTAHTQAQRAEVEAYLLRLSGRQHRVQMWDLRNPRPRGSIGLTGVTLGATAAQFATSLTLAGCRGANAVLGGSFEVDGNADNVGDGWARYSNGTTGALTAGLNSITGVTTGVYSQEVFAAALGATSVDRNGIVQLAAPVTHLAGSAVTAFCSIAGTAGTSLMLYVVWKDAGGSAVGSDIFQSITANGAQQSISIAGACPGAARLADIYVYQHTGSGAAAVMLVDSVSLVAGGFITYPSPATLLAGDWLGLTGGQLVRVVADATATDAGAMTVEVRHMLRAAVSSGTAVTLDKPTALYVRTESGLALPRQPGNVDPGLSLDLVEVFA